MKKHFMGMLGVFLILTVILYLVHEQIPAYNFQVLEIGNVAMFLLAVGTFMMVSRQADKPAAAFIRGVMGASFVKLMACMVAMLIYIVMNRDHIHKPSIFVLLGIYAVYTTVETLLLSKLARTGK